VTRSARPRPVVGLIALVVLAAVTAAACSSSSGWFQYGDPGSDAAGQPTIEPAPGSTAAATVIRVIDGDSLEVERSGQEIEVRLRGFNAPELYRESADGTDVETCQGDRARQALESLARTGSRILLMVDDTDEFDRFGRTLADLVARVEPGDEQRSGSAVASMVSGGWGFATGDRLDNRELMKQAAEDKRGMWGDTCGRPAATTIELGRIQADAPGNDRFNLTEEWVEIVNTGVSDRDLSGWMIRDDTTGHRFVLDRTVPAGGSLLVRTGAGSDDTATVHLDQSFPVWSNDRETVVLIDDSGVFVDWRFLDS
jgi:endonuclease YncB( thermonuclease family)